MKRLIVLACLLVSACGGNSSTSPTPMITFTGVYNGTYLISSCSDNGLTGLCAGAGFAPGSRFPVSMSLGQNSTSVSGTIMLGSINGNFQGTAVGSGLTGTATMNNIAVLGTTVIPNVTAWSSNLNGNSMTGNFTVTFAVAGFAGAAILNASLSSLTR